MLPPASISQHVYTRLFPAKDKIKKLLVFEKQFHHAFSYENCAGWAI
jgi:hypothetical protein